MTSEETLRLLRGRDLDALCKAVRVNYSKLQWMIVSHNVGNFYHSFEIKKKTGGTRIISSPHWRLKDAQRKIGEILLDLYEPKPAAQAFLRERDVLTNAAKHTRKRYVLNIDLRDFFASINFGRVRGALLSAPYSFSETVATFLAQLSTQGNALPQGAPTSPILSNIICRKLDNELQRLAKLYNCTYSRYADDITISTTKRKFPLDLAIPLATDDGIKVELGIKLSEIIIQNGFHVNDKKTRMQTYRARQVVTGLKVNQKINLDRQYIDRFRAILYSWEKFGLTSAQKKFSAAREPARPVSLEKSMAGKLAYIQRIKGDRNRTYRKIANKFFELTGTRFRYSLEFLDELKSNLWIVEVQSEHEIQQGTAFSVGPGHLITCAHVVSVSDATIKVFQHHSPTDWFTAAIESKNDRTDLAVLTFSEPASMNRNFLKIKYEAELKIGDELLFAGFPEYAKGNEPTITKSPINSFRYRDEVKRIIVDTPIFHGASGAPVLNSENMVIGIVATGAIDWAATKEGAEYGIISVDHLKPT